MNGKVFISYSHADSEVATALSRMLGEIGVECFLYEEHIPPGSSITREVQDALAECRAFVVILSPDSLASPWVLFEIGEATALGKRVIPLRTRPDLMVPGFMGDLRCANSLDEVVDIFRQPSRILIAGSSRYEGSDSTADLFRETCREVGRQLAERGLCLVVGSWALDTADRPVLDSYVRSRGRRVTIAGIVEQPESWWKQVLGPEVEVKYVQVVGSWDGMGRSVQVRESDAAFIIGGAKGAIELSKIYVLSNPRLVATPQLGRAAKSIWDKRVRERAMAASPDCVRQLESGTPSQVASAGLDLLSLL